MMTMPLMIFRMTIYKYIYRQKKRFQLTQIVIRKTLKNENRLELERNVHVHQIEIYSHTNKY